jgi:hypothetical protein
MKKGIHKPKRAAPIKGPVPKMPTPGKMMRDETRQDQSIAAGLGGGKKPSTMRNKLGDLS